MKRKKGLGVPDSEEDDMRATEDDIKMHVEHVNIRGSSAIHSVDYTDRAVLIVYMADGSKLEYGDVPKSIFDAFQKAESKGKFFNAYVRNTYDKIN